MSFWHKDGTTRPMSGRRGAGQMAGGSVNVFAWGEPTQSTEARSAYGAPGDGGRLPSAGHTSAQRESRFGMNFGSRRPITAQGVRQRDGSNAVFGDHAPPPGRPLSAVKAWDLRGHSIIAHEDVLDNHVTSSLQQQTDGNVRGSSEVPGRDIWSPSAYPKANKPSSDAKKKDFHGSKVFGGYADRPEDYHDKARRTRWNQFKGRDYAGHGQLWEQNEGGRDETGVASRSVKLSDKKMTELKGTEAHETRGYTERDAAQPDMLDVAYRVASTAPVKPDAVRELEERQARGFPIKHNPLRTPPGGRSTFVFG
ncbi:unnamed protein product [Pedinophyceae sp. YPF-701]|nr:unnamed protein product [Pedinophyceae sp. YPF-701]